MTVIMIMLFILVNIINIVDRGAFSGLFYV